MTKKKVTSTYRREYSPDRSAQRPCAIRNFDANFNYREYRRQAEHGHHRSPFVWDDWEYELQSRSGGPERRQKEECCKVLRVPVSSSGSDASSDENSCGRGMPHTSARRQGQYSASARSPPHASTSYTVQDPPQSDSECNCGVVKPHQVPRLQGQPTRVLSDTISKSLKKVSKKSGQSRRESGGMHRPRTAPVDDSPFVQFGIGDDEPETGSKRTYNVLSHQGVYSTATGAKQRQTSAKELKRREGMDVREIVSKTALHDPRFDDKMNKQTSRWQSEYKKRYSQFPVSRYH